MVKSKNPLGLLGCHLPLDLSLDIPVCLWRVGVTCLWYSVLPSLGPRYRLGTYPRICPADSYLGCHHALGVLGEGRVSIQPTTGMGGKES